MWSLIQNNPGMVLLIAVVVLIAILLHVGIYLAIRHLIRNEDSPSSRRE